MKQYFLIITSLLLLGLSSCTKEKNENVTVVKNCTGTYLKWNSKEYQVCNKEDLAPFNHGETAIATFKNCDDCNIDQGAICYMAYPSDGWIWVCKIENSSN